MREITGQCHCENIRYEFLWPLNEGLIPVRACGCTFCQKHGGVYTSHPQGELLVQIDDRERLNRYRFGTRTAEFFICTNCGVVPFVTSTLDDRLYAVVNVNTFENVTAAEMQAAATDFDDESLDQRLDRRQRNWIPHVDIRFGDDA